MQLSNNKILLRKESVAPVYCATKAFMHSFSLSLRHQFSAKNIEVIEVKPTALKTGLRGKEKHEDALEVQAFIDAIFSQLAEGQEELTLGYSKERTDENNYVI